MASLDKDGLESSPFFRSKKVREVWYILYALFWNVMTSFLWFSDHGTLDQLENENKKKDDKEIEYYIEVDKPGGRQQLRHRELETKGRFQ